MCTELRCVIDTILPSGNVFTVLWDKSYSLRLCEVLAAEGFSRCVIEGNIMLKCICFLGGYRIPIEFLRKLGSRNE